MCGFCVSIFNCYLNKSYLTWRYHLDSFTCLWHFTFHDVLLVTFYLICDIFFLVCDIFTHDIFTCLAHLPHHSVLHVTFYLFVTLYFLWHFTRDILLVMTLYLWRFTCYILSRLCDTLNLSLLNMFAGRLSCLSVEMNPFVVSF